MSAWPSPARCCWRPASGSTGSSIWAARSTERRQRAAAHRRRHAGQGEAGRGDQARHRHRQIAGARQDGRRVAGAEHASSWSRPTRPTATDVTRDVTPAAGDDSESGLANRKVRTVTVRPDGTIVSGDDAVAGGEALPVERPNVPAVPSAESHQSPRQRQHAGRRPQRRPTPTGRRPTLTARRRLADRPPGGRRAAGDRSDRGRADADELPGPHRYVDPAAATDARRAPTNTTGQRGRRRADAERPDRPARRQHRDADAAGQVATTKLAATPTPALQQPARAATRRPTCSSARSRPRPTPGVAQVADRQVRHAVRRQQADRPAGRSRPEGRALARPPAGRLAQPTPPASARRSRRRAATASPPTAEPGQVRIGVLASGTSVSCESAG